MSENFLQSIFAERIGGKRFGIEDKIYKFEKIKRAKAAALKANPGGELIDLGVGEPDDMAFPGVVETMQRECARWENRGYADNGIIEFKEAAAKYLEQVYGVKGIHPEKEIIHAIGSKPALAMMPAAFINPGDITLMTVPGYPVMGTHTTWYGGEVVHLPLREENGFLPDRMPLTGRYSGMQNFSISIIRTTPPAVRLQRNSLRRSSALRWNTRSLSSMMRHTRPLTSKGSLSVFSPSPEPKRSG